MVKLRTIVRDACTTRRAAFFPAVIAANPAQTGESHTQFPHEVQRWVEGAPQ